MSETSKSDVENVKIVLEQSNCLRVVKNDTNVILPVKYHKKLPFVSRNVKIDVKNVKTVSEQSNCLNFVKNDVTIHSACLTNVKVTRKKKYQNRRHTMSEMSLKAVRKSQNDSISLETSKVTR